RRQLISVFGGFMSFAVVVIIKKSCFQLDVKCAYAFRKYQHDAGQQYQPRQGNFEREKTEQKNTEVENDEPASYHPEENNRCAVSFIRPEIGNRHSLELTGEQRP